MKTTWDTFFEKEIRRMLVPGARVLDVAGGLRVDGTRGNVVDEQRAWIRPLLEQITYLIMDPVPTYHPDIVDDVMDMKTQSDASYDAVVCISVLEHIPNPWRAVQEIYRVLKPGGMVFLYVPFLTAYHAMPGYYGDYVRFTDDGVRALCASFQDVEVQLVRGPMATFVHLLPRPLCGWPFQSLAQWIDRMRPGSGKQTSGFYVTGRK
jgi:SAM-dependent methyltransferase